MSTERFQEALAYFRSVGYSRTQSAGIVGNLWGESKLDTKAIGDGGKAIGIAQWHPDRQANFKREFGKDIRNATFAEQLKFVHWELQNTEKAAGNALKNTTSIEDATKVFMQKYERPANMSSYNDRLKAAGKAYNIEWSGGSKSNPMLDGLNKIIGQVMGSNPAIVAGTVVGSKVGEEVADTFDKVVNYIPRAVAIIVGIALVVMALFILMGDKVNIENVISAVK